MSPTKRLLAANVDRVLLVTSMNQDFSVRRLERYLTLICRLLQFLPRAFQPSRHSGDGSGNYRSRLDDC
jgi:hypothetical protein